jgi:hypothetical protein
MDWAIIALNAVGGLIARVCAGFGDGAVMGVRRLFLAPLRRKDPVLVGSRFTYSFGLLLDRLAARRGRPVRSHYESVLAALMNEAGVEFKRVTRSISFGLLMFCLGVFATLVYLLWL